MFMWRKNCWCLEISILILISIFIVSGENISFDYPSTVNCYQSFNVNLTLVNFSIGIYDIKIDVNNATDRISRIWNGNSWQSSFNYVNDAINTSVSNSGNFLLNITTRNDTGNINITIRQDSKIWKFGTYPITIICTEPENQNNNTQDNSENNINQVVSQEKARIYLQLDYPEEIANNKELGMSVKAFNLESGNYDVKVYLSFENETIISETYDQSWQSSNLYVNNIIIGSGNITKRFTLRLKDSYKDFYGKAKIKAKIRKSGTDNVLAEEFDYIQINEKEVILPNSILNQNITDNSVPENTTNKIIRLNNPKDIKSQDVWESKAQLIKEYAIYGFIVFCIALALVFMFKIKKKKIRKK